MKYPRKLYANVLLLDGKIINWKTGSTSWKNDGWLSSSQPLWVFQEECDLQSKTIFFEANNDDENNKFFSVTSKDFYKKFEIHESYSKSMNKPY